MRVEDRPTRSFGICLSLLLIVAGWYCFWHGVLIEAWYALPGVLIGVLSFFVLVRFIAGALMQQALECTRSEVVLRRFRFGAEAKVQRRNVADLVQVRRGVVAYAKGVPIHGLIVTSRNAETLQTLRSMPDTEMQAFVLRLKEMHYPVVLDDTVTLDVRLGDPPAKGLWRWL